MKKKPKKTWRIQRSRNRLNHHRGPLRPCCSTQRPPGPWPLDADGGHLPAVRSDRGVTLPGAKYSESSKLPGDRDPACKTETFHSFRAVLDGKLCAKFFARFSGLSAAGFSDVETVVAIIWLVPCAPGPRRVHGCQADKTYMSSIR